MRGMVAGCWVVTGDGRLALLSGFHQNLTAITARLAQTRRLIAAQTFSKRACR